MGTGEIRTLPGSAQQWVPAGTLLWDSFPSFPIIHVHIQNMLETQKAGVEQDITGLQT